MARYPDKYARESHEINVRLSAERLSQIDTTKVVIIGGSGCGFGFNSQLIHNYFQMPVINTGTHASIGIIMQLKMYEKYFTKGDIVLIIPEYQQFTKKCGYGIEDETLYRILYNNNLEAFKYLTINQMINIIPFIPRYFQHAYANRYLIFDTLSPYSKSALNDYGDVTSWEYRKPKDGISIQTIAAEHPNDEIINFIKEFIHRNEDKGVKCVLLPPAYMSQSYDNNNSFINRLSDVLLNYEIPFVVSTERYKFADTLYYDTSYHMTYEGAMLRTQMIIEDLDSCLNLCK